MEFQLKTIIQISKEQRKIQDILKITLSLDVNVVLRSIGWRTLMR